ncbi:MAG: type II toxin-antitoxin system HicA family toxin [Flavobacteriales bacterium]|nr:type II toxin-antitoxin system HicA family toxin [Flavobacteriales bacterium]
MKMPRSVSAEQLIRKLRPLGYEVTRQTGSHIRLTTEMNGRHSITVPNHDPLRIGTLASILGDVSQHLNRSKQELIDELFG